MELGRVLVLVRVLYRGPSNSFCSYIFASLLVAIIRLQQGAPREGGEPSPPNQAFVGHLAMDIIWNLGDVERWNPNTPAPEYSRLEEPHLAINFIGPYMTMMSIHASIMMAAQCMCHRLAAPQTW